MKMKIEKFIERLKKAKKTAQSTASITNDLKVRKNGNSFQIYKSVVCSKCRAGGLKQQIFIQFQNQKALTIFQAGLLWSLFVENKKPYDYADYHKCIAGKEFIENIVKVEGDF